MQGDTAGGPAPEQVAADLADAVGRLLRRARSVAAEGLLTPTQRTVLARLGSDGPATTAALARAEYVRPQSMRLTLAALEEQGYVGRAPDPDDGRQSVMSITEGGRAALTASRAAKRSWLARAIAEELDADEVHTLVEASALLERLVKR